MNEFHKDTALLSAFMRRIGSEFDPDRPLSSQYEGIDHFVVWCWEQSGSEEEWHKMINDFMGDVKKAIG